jgi:hypothetical protein
MVEAHRSVGASYVHYRHAPRLIFCKYFSLKIIKICNRVQSKALI